MVRLKEKVLATGFVCMTEDELYAVNGGMRSQPDLIDGGGVSSPFIIPKSGGGENIIQPLPRINNEKPREPVLPNGKNERKGL